jgi:predicted TIM-barrel fold metal-dependent hydrolase
MQGSPMIDAYTHLDMGVDDPLAALERRMDEAAVDRAFIVETWNKDNRKCLEQLAASHSSRFRVAFCFRPEDGPFSPAILAPETVGGMRVRTADLRPFRPFAAELARSGIWLIPHCEAGIGVLADELLWLAEACPELRIYLPHLGWPRRYKREDEDWERSMSALSALPHLVAGVSAIAQFSQEAFPHQDVQRAAMRLREIFAPGRLCAGSDYPLFDTTRYADYMKLANEWIGRGVEECSILEFALFENLPRVQ